MRFLYGEKVGIYLDEWISIGNCGNILGIKKWIRIGYNGDIMEICLL